MLRRLSVSSVLWAVLLALLWNGTAMAQDDGTDGIDGTDDADEAVTAEATDASSYGDTELIEALRTYGLLDEWIAASPVSPEASLLLVTGNGGYQTQRRAFLNALDAWADRTEGTRSEQARIDAAQSNAEHLRAIVTQVRDALVRDDRLASNSKTLVEIEDALDQLASLAIGESVAEGSVAEQSQEALVLAESQLQDLRDRIETELVALNDRAAAVDANGVAAFVGFDRLSLDLATVDQLIDRARVSARPAQEAADRLASSAVAQIPGLHAARMLGPTDVAGMSVVTVDAYVRAAARSSCSVDWALLAGIGKIESNHGRMGGGSVSASGQVSTDILGPLLDGGEAARQDQAAPPIGAWITITEAIKEQLALHAAFADALPDLLRRIGERRPSGLPDVDRGLNARDDADETDEAVDADEVVGELDAAEEPADQGNGFAVVVDSDGGRLDGDDQWDRAIGPMQFLPETWSRYATDGNGDGVADPHNLYDAAASAARFLCSLSATRGSSPSSFVLGYNGSTSYVRRVLATADALRAQSLPTA